jgi:hypothetical protein
MNASSVKSSYKLLKEFTLVDKVDFATKTFESSRENGERCLQKRMLRSERLKPIMFISSTTKLRCRRPRLRLGQNYTLELIRQNRPWMQGFEDDTVFQRLRESNS